jgi:Lrp/AsnC family leucine-responsive transcriptional regulator
MHVSCAKPLFHADNHHRPLRPRPARRRAAPRQRHQCRARRHRASLGLADQPPPAAPAEAGIIAGHAALLDAAAIGLGVTAFAHVILERHGKSQSDAFESAATALPEVMDCYSVSGDADYLLRIVAPDLPAFSELMMKRVLRLPGVARITTNIALQKVKQTHVLPLDHLTQPARSRQQIRYSGGDA